MTAFDYAVLVVAGLSVLVGLYRGAVREVLSLASWVGSFLIALYFAPKLSPLLPESLAYPWLRFALTFAGVMLVALLVFALITVGATKLVRRSKLSQWDRGLGMLFGLARGLVIVVVLVLVAGMTPLPRQPAWRHALSSPPLVMLAKHVRPWLPEALSERIHFE
ncbi:MAG TPA: CvpA family protein [Burkholderiales bacterium]|nr:CvpA family protein [Burkholderiales bacterium]